MYRNLSESWNVSVGSLVSLRLWWQTSVDRLILTCRCLFKLSDVHSGKWQYSVKCGNVSYSMQLRLPQYCWQVLRNESCSELILVKWPANMGCNELWLTHDEHKVGMSTRCRDSRQRQWPKHSTLEIEMRYFVFEAETFLRRSASYSWNCHKSQYGLFWVVLNR